ncbi:hemolysin III family protein [Balneolaceae bacterium ANBcel3]|nr:hemolysin III family protein [Balneolaceae bacterium ANBcel3]
MFRTIIKYLRAVREPANTYTHLAGVLLSIPALVLLIHKSVSVGQATHIVAFSIFGTSMLLLYLASTLYHMLPVSTKTISILRRIDHMMIYVLIAGTYTPITLIVLQGLTGWIFFSLVWGIALAGIIFKCVWMHAPKWISLVLYLSMGWMAIFFLPMAWDNLKGNGMWLIITGGVMYSVGAILYAAKWPNPSKEYFNFHAIWHLFVLAGSFCFFWLMYDYVIYLNAG